MRDVSDRLEVQHRVAHRVLGQHRGLLARRRVAQAHAQHEAVELRLGQRVGPLVLDGVLGGQHHERARKLMRVRVDCHAALLHALEQTRLRLRRRAVDLVDQHDVREHRARPELEAVLALVVDVRPDHVGRQQIGGALDARKLGVDGAR